jgi:hypothetical protein
MPRPGRCTVLRVHTTRAHIPIAPDIYTQYIGALQLELERERARRIELDALYAQALQDVQAHIRAHQGAEEEVLRLGWARRFMQSTLLFEPPSKQDLSLHGRMLPNAEKLMREARTPFRIRRYANPNRTSAPNNARVRLETRRRTALPCRAEQALHLQHDPNARRPRLRPVPAKQHGRRARRGGIQQREELDPLRAPRLPRARAEHVEQRVRRERRRRCTEQRVPRTHAREPAPRARRAVVLRERRGRAAAFV